MFAPIPSWERNRKRRGFGGSRRTAAVAPEVAAFDDPALGATTLGAETLDTPAYASRPVARHSGGRAMAITAGVLAIGALAAAGWYASQPHESGVAQLTPGTTTTTSVATNGQLAMNSATAPPAATPAPVPAEPAAAPAATTTTRTTTTHVSSAAAPVTARRVTVARARPAATRSAGDTGVNASATLPAAPQPYSGSAASSSTTVNPAPAPSPAPVQSEPAPTPAAPAAPEATPPATMATPPAATPQ
jgi:Meckel syndrome type 1 protein